ncbi:MAG TPA: DnaJ domain-containing protein [Candidatus Binatia bacterium]|jgi:curved DNA-binding protein CbpA
MSSQDVFIDFYEVLEISPNAHPDTVARVYRMLAQRFHPDNKETGDVERFTQILQAYKVLGDPELRAQFDVHHQHHKAVKWRLFDAQEAAGGVSSDREIRFGVLSLLYNKRRRDPEHPSIAMYEIEGLLGIPREHLEFTFWFLREKSLIARTDGGGCTITSTGVDYLDQNGLPERAEALAGLPAGRRAGRARA